jgi:beta-galactosidase
MSFSRREFVLSLPAASLLRSAPADALSHPILSEPRIGAEFFLNATETRDSVSRHFQRMADTGLTIVRIFTLWDQVERIQGQWDFSRYDWIYDDAAKHGIYIANTLCAEDPPGWMNTAPFYHQWYDLSDPQLRPFSATYIEKVVNRYKSHKAHGVWLLQNEPGFRGETTPHTLASYRQWLERKYTTIDNLNRAYYRTVKSFAEVREPIPGRVIGWTDYPSNLDWRNFLCDHLAAQLRWIHAEIDKHHPGTLTHINPPGQTSNMPASGRDMWRLKPTAHFMGSSMHAAWHFTMFKRDDFGVAYSYCCDLVRSASAPAPWWVTELQAGPTIFTGTRPLNPTGTEISRWLWDAVGNGSRGVVFWLWHPRTEGNEGGEWGVAGPNGEETPRTRASKEVAAVLKKHRDFFSQAIPEPARAAILYNRDAMILYPVDAWRRPSDELIHSLMGCYKALHRANVPVDFIDSSQLDNGVPAQYSTLYLPYSFALSKKSCLSIRAFVRDGGTVWADALVAWKDENGVTKQFPPGPLSDVFGFTLDDLDAQWDPFPLSGNGDTAGELYRGVIPSSTKARVLLTDPDGRPTATVHSYGKGKAYYYATALTLAYLRREDPRVTEWIASPAKMPREISLAESPAGAYLRTLRHPDGRRAAILTHWGRPGRAILAVPPSTRAATNLLTGAALPIQSGSLTLDLTTGASAVILLT